MKKRRKEMKRQKFPRREESKGKWRSGLFIWAAVDRAFVPLVSVNVNASQTPDMLLAIAPLTNPRPKFPAAGLSREGGDDDYLAQTPPKTRASGGAITVYRGRYRESTATLLGRSVVLGVSADRRSGIGALGTGEKKGQIPGAVGECA